MTDNLHINIADARAYGAAFGILAANAQAAADAFQNAFTMAIHQLAGRPTARPRIVCLCGSTRFYDAFQQANYDETMAGRIVLSVGFYPHAKAVHGHGEGVGHDSAEKAALDELHKRKIDLADEVLVLNVGGYVGDSTRSEIAYAERLGKPIRWLENPGEHAAEANPDGAKAKCSMAECPNPQAAWGVCGEHMLDIGRDICAEENPAQPGEICWKPSSHGAVEGTPCRYAPAAELERADPFEHPTGAPCTDPWCDDKTGHETHADDRASQTAPAENRCAHCGDVIHLIDGTWKHGPGLRSPHDPEPANLAIH